MRTDVKPLFRPEAVRPRLAGFVPPPTAEAGRKKLAEWAALLGRWRPARSPWLDLLEEKEARSGGIITGLPGVNFAEGTTVPTGNGQLAWQTFGDLLPLRTAVLAVSDGPVAEVAPDLTNAPAADEAAFERVRVPECARSTPQQVARTRVIAELRHGDAAQCERCGVVAQRDELEGA